MNKLGWRLIGVLAFDCWLAACKSPPPPESAAATAVNPPVALTQTVQPGATVTVQPAIPTRLPASPVARLTATPTVPPTIRASTSLLTPSPSDVRPTLSPPAIISFTFSPTQVRRSETFTITWITTNAETVDLTFLDYKGRLGLSTPLPPSGSRSVDHAKISAVEGMAYYFVVTASNYRTFVSQGGRVDIICETTWFFSPSPPDCPSEPQSTQLVAQRFEYGLMLWAPSILPGQATKLVLNDTGYQPWAMFKDDWVDGLPESDPAIIPPPGYYQPIRGFGVLWRTGQDGLLNPIRDRLGWALAPEASLGTGFYQCDRHSYTTCYITGPADHVYVLRPEHSGWYVWPGAVSTHS